MAVTFDAVGPTSAGQVQTTTAAFTWTHTPAGTPTEAVVFLVIGLLGTTNAGDLGSYASVSYGGSAMTLDSSVAGNNSTFGGILCYKLASPPSGAQTVSVGAYTLPTGGTFSQTLGFSITAAGGGGGFAAHPSPVFGNAASGSLSFLGTTSGGLCIAGACDGTGAPGEGVTSGTQRFLKDQNSSSMGNAIGATLASTGGTTTISFTWSADFFGIVGVEVLPAGGGAAYAPSGPNRNRARLTDRRARYRRQQNQDAFGVPPQPGVPGNAPGGLIAKRRPAWAVWGGVIAGPVVTLIDGTVPPNLTVRSRYPSRAVWRGTVSAIVNAGAAQGPAGTAPDHLVVARRAATRAVWRGFVSETVNQAVGQAPELTARVHPRRYPARAVWRGFVSETVNQAVGQTQDLATRQPRRYPSRAVWRGFISRTTNQPVGSAPELTARVHPRRYPSRAVWRGFISETVNQAVGTTPGLAARVPARRYPSRAYWLGYVSRTVNAAPGTTGAGFTQPPATRQPRRPAARVVWRGFVSSTVNGAAGQTGVSLTQNPATRQPRRTPARAVWRGFVSETVNQATGQAPELTARVHPRRYPSRAVWRGTVATTTNALTGSVPELTARVHPRRYPPRAVWRGNTGPVLAAATISAAPPRCPVVAPSRAHARGQWRGYVARTTNALTGEQPGGLIRRRYPSRAYWRGYTSRTVNFIPVPPPNGTQPPCKTVTARPATRISRCVVRGYTSRTTQPLLAVARATASVSDPRDGSASVSDPRDGSASVSKRDGWTSTTVT